MSDLPITPFRRAGADIAQAGGAALAEDKIRQVLLTEPGELPWRPDFGVGLEGLLHRANDTTTAELARIRAREGFDRWLGSDVRVRQIEPSREHSAGGSTKLSLAIRFEVKGSRSNALVELADTAGVS